jgi:protein-L-isoaspartate(D-aspartate) O-methyltransferase
MLLSIYVFTNFAPNTVMMQDSFRHKGMRNRLVEVLREKGILDEQVLSAIATVPRHLFFDKAFLEFSYQDKAFPIGAGQTISQPYTVAFQSQLLEVEKGEKILEIGTGSGYQCSILCELGAKMFSIERQRLLYDNSKAIMVSLGFRPKQFFGDGYKGLPTFAPFSKVIVTCGAPFVPKDLLSQLKIGGRLVIPVGEGDVQIMTMITRTDESTFEKQEYGEFRFVPMLTDKSR